MLIFQNLLNFIRFWLIPSIRNNKYFTLSSTQSLVHNILLRYIWTMPERYWNTAIAKKIWEKSINPHSFYVWQSLTISRKLFFVRITAYRKYMKRENLLLLFCVVLSSSVRFPHRSGYHFYIWTDISETYIIRNILEHWHITHIFWLYEFVAITSFSSF